VNFGNWSSILGANIRLLTSVSKTANTWYISQSRTRCDDLKLAEVHEVISDGKLNDDVSEGWKIVRTIQRDRCSSRYSAWILTTQRVVPQGRCWDERTNICQADDKIVRPPCIQICMYRVGQKSKPDNFCNNFVYCQPISIIFGTYTL